MSDKLAYVRLFAPYGWAMGTGDYLDLWHAARLKEGIERLRAWKFGDTGRFEVLGLDGQILLQPPSPAMRARTTGSSPRPRSRTSSGACWRWPTRGRPHGVRLAPAGQRHRRHPQRPRAALRAVEHRARRDPLEPGDPGHDRRRESQRLGLPVVAPALRGLVAVLAILGAILASALFSRWMIGLLQGYKRDLDAHALALEQKAGELHLAGHVFESSKEGILITDAERRILAVNPAFTAISGYRAEEVVGKQPDLLASGKHEPDFYRSMWQTIRETGSWSGEIWNQRRDGSVFPELLQITTVRSAGGEVLHYVGTFLDLTERKEAEDRIRQLAEFDPSPGCPTAACCATGWPRRWPAPSARTAVWRPWSSTSTASRPSTTPSATPSATSCCRAWPPASASWCATATR
jgi:PAS domain S-box-containing protein